MFARIGAWQGSPDALEQWISRACEQVKPSIQQDPGLKAAYWLVDREGGKRLIITIWESAEAMRANTRGREGRRQPQQPPGPR